MKGINFGRDEIATVSFWRAVAAEFLGSVFFLLCVTCVALSWSNSTTAVSANNVELGIGIGLAIATLAFAFGHVSGGHLNPAVSIGMIVGCRISIIRGLAYVVAQVVGGIVGSALTYWCTHKGVRENLGATLLSKGVTSPQGFGLELLFTFILVFYVFSITDPKKKTDPFNAALGIGVTILVCHVCLVPFTGCGINPARSFGPALIANKWKDHWVYWVGPLAGGILAPLFYNYIFFAKDEQYVQSNGEGGKDIKMSAARIEAA